MGTFLMSTGRRAHILPHIGRFLGNAEEEIKAKLIDVMSEDYYSPTNNDSQTSLSVWETENGVPRHTSTVEDIISVKGKTFYRYYGCEEFGDCMLAPKDFGNFIDFTVRHYNDDELTKYTFEFQKLLIYIYIEDGAIGRVHHRDLNEKLHEVVALMKNIKMAEKAPFGSPKS